MDREQLERIVTSVPKFRSRWDSFLSEWEPDGEPPWYIGMNELAHYVVDCQSQNSTSELPNLFATIEDILQQPDPEIDSHNRNRVGAYRCYMLDDPRFHPFTYGHMIEEYIRHPEAKSLGPDGKHCTAETRGLLQRAHITAGKIRYIDKETSSMWEQGDDLSVITDNDETGFRVIEYGQRRKVVLPESMKTAIRDMGLRELRRRGIGQHTIEKALASTVRIQSYRKIASAIDVYEISCQ